VIDLLQDGAVNGLGRAQGVEDRDLLPPATLQSNVEVQPLRLCKTSGLRSYQGGGAGKNVFGGANFVQEMDDHYLWSHQTVRAAFCSRQCQDLWRDTKKRREQGVEL
jgi:hypothetical protein